MPSAQKADNNLLHCAHGDSHVAQLRETARQLNVKLNGELRPCDGYMQNKGLRKAIPKHTHAHKKLGRVFVDLTGPKNPVSQEGNAYAMLTKDDATRLAWSCFLNLKDDVRMTFAQFLVDVSE